MEALGVAVVGFGWMGRVHAQAYARVPHHFPDILPVRLVSVADDVPGRAEAAAQRYGFGESTPDWRSLVGDPRVGAVSITAPNFLHREMGSAFAAAGQHIWIEKPVGLTADDARAIVGDVQVAVGFNYRNAPAVEKARELIAAGGIGSVTHARFRFLSDYAAHPDGALSWRFERARGGNGVLGDLGAHGVDLIRYLLGEIDSLVADTATFIPERPRPTAATAGHERGSGEPGPVENDDYFGSLLRMASGARVMLDCSRVAVGEQNSYGFEIHGTRGALFWDFRRMGELGVSTGSSYQDEPVRTLFAGPLDGDFGAFQPGAGIPMGYDDLKVIEAARFLRSVSELTPYGANLVDAIRAASVLDAMEQSVVTGGWVTPSR
ncbi:Gfo/Idh/MocA family oxidoreductase [Actinoplanes bogorensis]|uniref:Gfo/Idh/MocA family oxidoreductase n=1 Tax=Paractinoplanes bogorensis TaxID=1610840 RepID=A0ABS5YVA9_9ACTN|nr:Gfo/Idh/MocA family oxidoreductase [Actinoplanes bogorensis]MBU2667390.1 Gfo/Idh/MocA family oxidoreductase [Actinoplanes bogorensis]